jgi:hypothetical protein
LSILLTRQYKKTFNSLVTKHNFKMKKKLYYKLINNELLQTISLDKGKFGLSFTINIGIFPLCIGLEEDQIINGGTFQLGELINNSDTKWEFNPINANDIELAIKATYSITEEKVLPIFENVIDSKAYLDFVNNLNKKLYGHISWNSDLEMWVYLKLKNYERVICIVNNIERQNYEAAAGNRNGFSKHEYQEYLKGIERSLDELRNIKYAIERNDTAFIDSILQKNEDKSIRTLEGLGINPLEL